MLVKTYSSALLGIDPLIIHIEVNVESRGFKFYMVGLPDSAVKESEHRIHAAVRNCGFRMPETQVIVNLAPADIRKEGSVYDLGIAIGMLCASDQLTSNQLDAYVMLGELSLDGSLQPIRGALAIAAGVRKAGFKGIILPLANAKEAAVVEGIEVIGANSLKEVANFLEGVMNINPTQPDQSWNELSKAAEVADFSEVKGQEGVKRALEVAAAGGHNIILIGPPGVGKTMLARRIPGILPPLSPDESLETTKIHSVSGSLPPGKSLIAERPFRNPHHTVSDVALVGGGSIPKPGEISLAHNGILFLDELPEFKRGVLEVLRQPMEDRFVTIARTRITVRYPSSFMLVASMNPSPSGDFYDPDTSSDSEQSVLRYLSKISGPLLDRIDLHIEVNPIPYDSLASKTDSESSSSIRERVIKAREIQTLRYIEFEGIHCNAQMTPKMMRRWCNLTDSGDKLLKSAAEKLGFSARSYARILKVARTIADLEAVEQIEVSHLAEAIQYRSLDRQKLAPIHR